MAPNKMVKNNFEMCFPLCHEVNRCVTSELDSFQFGRWRCYYDRHFFYYA